MLLSHTLLEGLRKLERCRSRSLALITYTEEVLHIPCLTKPASILCSQVHPKPLAMTLSHLGCWPLLRRDYFDPSSDPMPVILAWFPSFVLWVIFDLCRYRNTKRVMLTTFAEMQELGRQVESVSSHSKVSILYSVSSCRADLSERSILNYTIPQSASLPQMSFSP